MNVKLVSLTTSKVEEKELTAEELLVYIARVSNPSNQLNTETADKLLGFLIKSKHWSPFDMVNLCIEVTTSKAIAIQILRHWSIKPQEFSQRYAEVTEIEDIEFRFQAEKNRQSSIDNIGKIRFDEGAFNIDLDVDNLELREWVAEVASYLEEGLELYQRGIEMKVAKECARMILPMATSTTMYLNGSVRSWIHYLEQRTSEHAQKEHREVAAEVQNIFNENFPNIAKALNWTKH